MIEIDLKETGLRALNQRLRATVPATDGVDVRILNPMGTHAIGVGLDAPLRVVIEGHVGFYCGGMNKQADLVVNGHAGPGVAENLMSGSVRVCGNASQMAGASGHGGLLVVDGDTSSRCGISMKGIDIIVQGSVGHMSAFMAQKGHLVVCGDAGANFGDSIYEAVLFVRGAVHSLGADCIEKETRPEHIETISGLLARAGVEADPKDFRRYGSARTLYNFNVAHADQY